MQRQRLALVLVPFVALACTSQPDAPPPQVTPQSMVGSTLTIGHPGALSTAVVLERSFAVTRDGGELPTHVPAVVFTPDGQRLWIGSATGDVIEFDAASRAVRRRARFSDAAIAAVSIDRDARVLCWLGGGALEARPLDAPFDDSAATLGRVEGVGDAKALALSPTGDLVALGRADGVVEVRRLPDLDVVATMKRHGAAVTGLAFSPDGARLAATGDDGLLVVANARDLSALHTESVSEPLYAACWSPDGEALFYGGHARVVDRLETDDWESERLLEGQPYFITTLGVSPDGSRLAIGDESCDVWIYDLQARAHLFHSKHHVECWLSAVAWAPDSETFLFGCRPNTLADTPALYAPNRAIEAFQDHEHLALLEQERAEVRALIASVEKGELDADPAQREKLVAALRQRDEQLATPVMAMGTSIGGGAVGFNYTDVQVNQTGVIPVLAPELGLNLASVQTAPSPNPVATALESLPADAAPATRAALERLSAMSVTREAVLADNVQELSDGFQINVWKAAKR